MPFSDDYPGVMHDSLEVPCALNISFPALDMVSPTDGIVEEPVSIPILQELPPMPASLRVQAEEPVAEDQYLLPPRLDPQPIQDDNRSSRSTSRDPIDGKARNKHAERGKHSSIASNSI